MTELLPELFLASAERVPDAPAVISSQGERTYREVERAARRVARALLERGVEREEPVGVLVAPGPEQVAALIGIWLAGAGYLPLDPLSPPARVAELLAASGTRVAVCDRPEPLPVAVLSVAGIFEQGPEFAAEPATSPVQAAYVLFTSGSTGRPKAVVVEHAAFANLIRWHIKAQNLTAEDRILQKTPLTFDAAGWELFAPLVLGGPVVFGRPAAGHDAAELIASIRERRATVLQVVPSMLRHLAADRDLAACTSLRLISCGGEALHVDLCRQTHERLDVEIWNTYGPTECCVDVLACRYDPARHTGRVPIGRPIDGIRVLLERPENEPDAGATDVFELFVGGAGVGRGYLGDPARTAERFLPDPDRPAARVYRTGDLVRRDDDGELEFVGRLDDQVKINGVRIEPGEIEAALMRHPAVREAVVRAVDHESGVRRLIGWVVGPPDSAEAELIAYLRDRLPSSLVPARLVSVPEFPRTSSGKTDRARLPVPDSPAALVAVEPLTPMQRVVAEVWQELLGVPRVGPDSDFFQLGGHSLQMMRLAAGLTEATGLAVDFRELHYAATVRAQAALLTQATRADPITRVAAGARTPLSRAQERLWVLDRMNPGSREYVVPLLVWLPAEVGEETVARALDLLTARHDVLRLCCTIDREGPAARIEHAARIPLRVSQTEPEKVGDLLAGELGEGFDLSVAPLARALLVRDGGARQLLCLTCHHIISDGWSSRLLEQQLSETIDALHRGAAPAHRVPELRYVDVVAWQRARLTQEDLAGQSAYWSEQLAALPALELTGMRPRPAVRGVDGAGVRVSLSAESTAALIGHGRQLGVSPFVVFLTLWTIALSRMSGTWDYGVGIPHAGRSRPEMREIVGLFVNVVVIRARLTPDLPFTEALRRVAQTCREGFARSDVPFEEVVDAVRPQRDASRTPLYQVLFTMIGDGMVGQRWNERDLELLGSSWSAARTDLSLTLWPDVDGGCGGVLEYALELYDADVAAELVRQLGTLAERFAADAGRAVGEAGLQELPSADASGPAYAERLRVVLGLIRELLGRQDVGPDQNTMDLGGNSLMVARLLWSVQEEYGVEIPMREFFDRPTAADLAREIQRLERESFDAA